MALNVLIHVEKNGRNEEILGALGLLELRWNKAKNAYSAMATGKAWTAIGQQSHLIPLSAFEAVGEPVPDRRHQASKETLRKFARAAAVADGNAFFGAACDSPTDHEKQYMQEAEWAAMVLEGLGLDPDTFASLFPDPASCFAQLKKRD